MMAKLWREFLTHGRCGYCGHSELSDWGRWALITAGFAIYAVAHEILLAWRGTP